MPDETNEGVEETEVAEVAPPTESNDSAEEKQKAESFAKKSEDQDRNWKETRRKMQELERRAKEQDELIAQMKSAPKAVPEVDELDKLGDEDIVTKGQAKKLAAKMAEEIAQRIVQQRENSTVEERLGIKFQDYNQVVTRENIELLKETEPELAMSLSHNTDPYSQGIAAYKLLKRLGIGEAEVSKEPVREKQKAIANSQKPLSVNAVTKSSAIGNAHMFENGLTEELKKSLRQEMAKAIKGY
jgi:predicted RND superfamily exporter protein